MEPTAFADLPQGTIRYRDTGHGKPIVFVHGLLVDGSLWRNVTPALEREYRCIVPDWPLGSHREPMKPSADMTPRGVARTIGDFLEKLDLRDVTLVGNDTGGALAQMLVVERPQRIARLVLTPCDCYDNFLPPAFRWLQWLAHVPGALQLAVQPMRLAAVRNSPLGFGLLTCRPIPAGITAEWVKPSLNDARVRADTLKLLRAIDSRDTLDVAERLHEFTGPALIAWSRTDPVFSPKYALRLAEALPNARLTWIDDSRGFVPEDQPERLAQLIARFIQETVAAVSVVS
jgi:pimeloyl-ACP methyl ester carboxylesterase